MNKKNSRGFPIIGGSSLLVIFAVLCLAVFAMLSLSTAQADRRLADTSIQAVADYYAADSRAEEILARLRTGQMPEEVTQNGTVYSYSCINSPSQSLFVEVSENSWEVLRWQAQPTVDWQEDDSMELWRGNR